jgi:flagellar biogenesis protein FliO
MEMIRESLVLVLIFGLLWAAVWLLRHKGKFPIRGTKPALARLESRGKLALSARHSIHLVRAGDRELILALHPDGITFLGDAAIPPPPERQAGLAGRIGLAGRMGLE